MGAISIAKKLLKGKKKDKKLTKEERSKIMKKLWQIVNTVKKNLK